MHQIMQSYESGSTGQLSVLMYSLYTLGSVTRVFTTIVEVDDKLMLFGYFSGLAINGTICAQIVYYWKKNSVASPIKYKQVELDVL